MHLCHSRWLFTIWRKRRLNQRGSERTDRRIYGWMANEGRKDENGGRVDLVGDREWKPSKGKSRRWQKDKKLIHKWKTAFRFESCAENRYASLGTASADNADSQGDDHTPVNSPPSQTTESHCLQPSDPRHRRCSRVKRKTLFSTLDISLTIDLKRRFCLSRLFYVATVSLWLLRPERSINIRTVNDESYSLADRRWYTVRSYA